MHVRATTRSHHLSVMHAPIQPERKDVSMKLSDQMRARIAGLVAQRSTLHDEQAAILAAVEKRDNKTLTDDEQKTYDEKRDAKKALDTEISECETRLTEIEDEERRDAKAAESRAKYGQPGEQRAEVNEPDIYTRGNGNSYFRDLGSAVASQDMAALDRLRRHSQHAAETRALGNTNAAGGSGGEFAPPQWVVDEWINLIRAGRVTADLFTHEDVPAGYSSVNYPKILTGTTTAIQSTQNTALSQTDLTTGSVQTGFATIGGKQVVSQQLLDQSAINFDQVILRDLAADYALRVGTQIFTGTGTGSGTNAVVNGLGAATIGSTQTWTQASPTAAGFYGQAGALLSKFLSARLAPPTAWIMSPRRWYWLASSVDGNNRPLVVPTAVAVNPMAQETSAAAANGMVGYFHGLPVYIDPVNPINLGGGTNQDNVYLVKADDLILFESAPKAEAFRETYADSVGVLFRMYGYVGTILNRHTESIGVITGTGLVTPTFAS